MNYIKNIIANVKNTFTNMDLNILKILKLGLKLCFILMLISTYILYIYLSIKTQITYKIGISLFRTSTCFICAFIAFSVCFNKIKKDI